MKEDSKTWESGLTMASMEGGLLSVKAAAKFCSCSEDSIRRAINSGHLAHYRIGNLIRVSPDGIHDWVLAGGRIREVA